MKSLNEKEWMHFKIPEIFKNVQRGKRLKRIDHISGNTPYVSSTADNNGVDDYIEETTGTRVFNNCISLANSGSVGTAFYEPFNFVASDHVTALKTNGLSEYVYLFLTSTIEKQSSNFNFNREINNARIKNMQIMVPRDNNDKPDYNYMEKYVQQKYKERLHKYQDYLKERIVELGNSVDISALDEIVWAEFRIGELFEVSRPSARNKDNYQEGDVPFVASGSVNNGVMKLCVPLDNEQLDKGGCITVSPVDGSTFFQPMDFLGRGGAGSSILMLRCTDLNLYRGQFLALMIEQTCSKYTYGHMGNKDSIKHERIILPVNNLGEPDYAYMEQYAKNMMIRKYKQYLSFLKSKSILLNEDE